MRICTLFLLSSCSPAHGLNPLLFYERRRCPIKFSHFRFNLLTKPRFFTVAVSATENGVFTSPEIARSFDFSSEERIYNCDPFVVSMLPPNVTGSLHMGHAMFVTLEDLNLSTERLTANKAFTNKLWNAGKFVLQNLPSQTDVSAWDAIMDYKFDREESVCRLPLPECWVLSKLHVLIDMVTTSYDKFFFGDIGRETYDFFWSDFADWLFYCMFFENVLKLVHPFMPFVIEELWQALPERKEALIVSPWPQTSLPPSELHKKIYTQLTRAIRNAQAEYLIEPAKRISASIVASEEVIQYISNEKEVLALLSRLDLQNVHFIDSPPGDANQSVHLVASEGLETYLPLADMVDISAEVEGLSKRLSKMQVEYNGLVARLSSQKFVEKAPKDVVHGVREKAAEAEE